MTITPTPDLGAMYRAMDKFEQDCRRCTCDWDGAPDARQPRTPNTDCPVHQEEDDIEQARRTR